ncbi:PAP2 superfamily protein [Orientia chuto str. Dubai]|uniref:PAP2 superfamily protein n=1 Tax=Orientia chuto str. Dubai TaxID=1359168 RepID=A0A0F3MPJ9_9RICK|nr:phosphatase PAP2 family protein [Candidatus Orientia mediorientalis]KJV56539.1 PAP2 superfamily protein [Orientia chuto str. Dubai]
MKAWLYDFNGWNVKLFLIINQITNSNEYIAKIFYYISRIFYAKNFTIYYLLLAFYFFSKLRNYYSEDRARQFNITFDYLLHVGAAYVMFLLIYNKLKHLFSFTRPCCSLSEIQTVIDFKTEYINCFTSFPSAHTGIAFFITFFLWDKLNTIGKFIGVIVVVMVGVSRIALAMHYPADVIYSCIITAIIIYIVKIILNIKIIRTFTQAIQNKIYMLASKIMN